MVCVAMCYNDKLLRDSVKYLCVVSLYGWVSVKVQFHSSHKHSY